MLKPVIFLSIILIFVVYGDVTTAEDNLGYVIHVERVKDGDTLVGTIVLPWNVQLRNPKGIRALELDAWESRSYREGQGRISPEEQAKGKEAKKALEGLIFQDGAILYGTPGVKEDTDNYGRYLCKLFIVLPMQEPIDVAAWMISHGHDRRGMILR